MIWKSIFVCTLAAVVSATYNTIETQGCTNTAYGNQFEVVQGFFKNFADCAKGLFDPSSIYREIEGSRPRGAMAVVFNRYCEKSAELKSCMSARLTAAIPSQRYRDEITSADTALNKVIEFLCYNYGERLSVFNEDGGPACFLEQANEMLNCFDSAQKDIPNFPAAIRLSKEDQCAKYGEITQCVIGALRNCATPTPSGMAESLFSSIYNDSPCKDYQF